MGSSLMDHDENYRQWLVDQGILQKKYGVSASDEHVKQWLEDRSNNGGASSYQWLESQGNTYGAGTSSGGSNSKTNYDNAGFDNTGTTGDAWQDWLSETKSSASEGNNGATLSKTIDATAGFRNINDANYQQEWLEYQHQNKQVKYDANGMYGNPQESAANIVDSHPLASTQQQQLPAVAASDPSISTIDWPVQGLAHTSCTASNGCSPSHNVTVLVVYGPEYHTHISEMAWNVATGVHAAFQSHIRHHPSSPLHGHIVFGHTVNVTFLDVMAADAVIIGSPVYNGNLHPDVQNWINYWHIDADLSNKFGGAFATAGGIHAGADGTIMSILRSMMVFQMMAVGGDSWTSPFGVVATMYEDPFGDTQRTSFFDTNCYYTQAHGRGGDHLVHPYFLRKAYGLGERIANVTVAWKNSSYVRWN